MSSGFSDSLLSQEQNELIGELVDNALSKAAASMEQMLKIRIETDHTVYATGPLDYIPEFDQLGLFKVHLVKLLFSGDIHGAFYFAILDHEVDLINSVCLPEEFKSGKRSESKLMKHGFMTEIENVVAALSVREISEALGVQVELRVPKIQILPGNEINDYFEKENKIHKTAFHVKALLKGSAVNISPLFIWVLDEAFLKVLRLNTSGG